MMLHVATDVGDDSLSLKLAKIWQTPNTFSPSRVAGPRLTFSFSALNLGAILCSRPLRTGTCSQAAGQSDHSHKLPGCAAKRSERNAHLRSASVASRGRNMQYSDTGEALTSRNGGMPAEGNNSGGLYLEIMCPKNAIAHRIYECVLSHHRKACSTFTRYRTALHLQVPDTTTELARAACGSNIQLAVRQSCRRHTI